MVKPFRRFYSDAELEHLYLSNRTQFRTLFRSRFKSSVYFESLPPSDIDSMIEYLKGPTAVGIWGIKTKVDVNGFDKHIIEKYLKNDDNLPKEDPQELRQFTSVLASISFLFSLFYYIYQKEQGAEEKEWISKIQSFYLDIIKKINIDEIKSDFPSAYKIFKEKFISEDFNPNLSNDLFFFSNHFFFVDRNFLSLTITSTNFESIDIMNSFLVELKHIKPVKIAKLFSPAEMVFSLYIHFLKYCYSIIVSSEELQQKISIAISEFEQQRYPHCVNTLGIFTESLLVEMYETLFREELDKEMPMGPLFIVKNLKFNTNLIDLTDFPLPFPDRPRKINFNF